MGAFRWGEIRLRLDWKMYALLSGTFEIVYGLPDIESFDFEKYEVGGCCVTPNDPKFSCTECGKSW